MVDVGWLFLNDEEDTTAIGCDCCGDDAEDRRTRGGLVLRVVDQTVGIGDDATAGDLSEKPEAELSLLITGIGEV